MNETYMMPAIACDFLTGSYLIHRRSEKHIKVMREISAAFAKVGKQESLTEREKILLGKLSEQFYGGPKDMCEQLNVDFVKYVKVWIR